MHYTLMHISDLHTGWHFDMQVAEQLARQAHEIRPDLLVISGDLVLRADITAQWNVITAFLNMLPQPQLIVPGNHDVSLFNGLYRLFAPLKRYRRYITPNLNPVFSRPGLAVVGGCSAHGLTIDGGWLYPDQIRALDTSLAQFGADTCKILVLHHHIAQAPGVKDRAMIANKHAAIRLMEKHQVELFLCGHVHLSYIATTRTILPDMRQNVIISQCGTSTSRRGRGNDHRKNSFHLLTIDDHTIQITPYYYQPDSSQFSPTQQQTFQRHRDDL